MYSALSGVSASFDAAERSDECLRSRGNRGIISPRLFLPCNIKSRMANHEGQSTGLFTMRMDVVDYRRDYRPRIPKHLSISKLTQYARRGGESNAEKITGRVTRCVYDPRQQLTRRRAYVRTRASYQTIIAG